MKHHFLYRNVRSHGYLELFLITAISALLINRFFLHITHYPSIGGGTLHIAHMLWGGLLMLTALILCLSFLGERIKRLAAFVGGIGFGLFIDELGKFITRDNNYFFRPTIGLIYATFIILYLIFNFLGRANRLTPREYELNALNQLEEAILNDLDPNEKRRIQELLQRADAKSPVTQSLKELLKQLDTVPPSSPSFMQTALTKIDRLYEGFWQYKASGRLVGLLFIGQALIFLVAILFTMLHSFKSLTDVLENNTYGQTLMIGQLLSSVVAGTFAVIGAFKLLHNRVRGFEWFRRALLINLFLTEFFIFSRVQFGAMPGFLVNLLLLVGLHSALHEERRNQVAH